MEITLFVLGIIVSIPVGLLTNVLYQRTYKPLASIQFDNPTALQRGVGGFVALGRRLLGKPSPVVIDVITAGRFIDTAIFVLSVMEAAKETANAVFRIKQVDWDAVPFAFSRSGTAIAYMNRREVDDIRGKVELWGNLCAFLGYALVGRPGDFPNPVNTLEEASEELRRLLKSRRLELLNFGSDSLKVLRTPLTPVLSDSKIEYRSFAVDDGLARFLSGQGDLYIGGLPQRLECARKGMVELITSQNQPLMMGIECFVYKGIGADVEVLEKVSISWSRVCRRLMADEGYCRQLYSDWEKSCNALGISASFTLDDFVHVLYREPGKYLRFFVGRDDAAKELIRATNLILADDIPPKSPRRVRKTIIEALHSIFTGAST